MDVSVDASANASVSAGGRKQRTANERICAQSEHVRVDTLDFWRENKHNCAQAW